MSSALFRNVIDKMITNHIYSIYMYKDDLALNKPQGLTCHKTQPANQPANST